MGLTHTIVYVRLSFMPDVKIGEAIEAAVRCARSLSTVCKFNFQGVEVEVMGNTNIGAAVADYNFLLRKKISNG